MWMWFSELELCEYIVNAQQENIQPSLDSLWLFYAMRLHQVEILAPYKTEFLDSTALEGIQNFSSFTPRNQTRIA